MFRKAFFCAAVALVLVPLVLAQTADEIIAKNVQARGGLDKIKAVQSMKMTGNITIGPGMQAPITMVLKRPDMARMEFVVQGLTGIRAYDGNTGWAIMPFTGKKDPETLSADDVKDIQDQSDIDGPLVDYKSKGHQVELLGKDKVEGTDAYKLKLTRKNGDIDTIYIDADSFLAIKEEGKRVVRGTEKEFESAISDYREVGGLMFPFAIESGQKGGTEKEKITIDKIELNVPAEDASFKMPAAAPASPAAAKPPDTKPPKD